MADTEGHQHLRGVLKEWLQRAQRAQRPRSPRAQRVMLAIGLAVFCVGAALAWRALPDVDTEPRWGLLAVALIVGPVLTVGINGAEYAVSARILGRRAGFWPAIRVSVLATAANLLPIPGSVIVRTQALANLGATYRKALLSTLIVGLGWIGTVGVIAGSLQLATTWRVGLLAVLVGLALLVVTHMLIRSEVGSETARSLTTQVLAVEASLTVVGGLRFYLILLGLGLDVSLAQAIALTVAGALASATGIFPGGLGIREVLAAAISPLIGIPAAVGLIATATDRLAGLVVLAVITAVLIARRPASGADHSEVRVGTPPSGPTDP